MASSSTLMLSLSFGKVQQEYDIRMQRVMQRLKDVNLKLNWAKCQN